MKLISFLSVAVVASLLSCKEDLDDDSQLPLFESTTQVSGQAVIKALPTRNAFVLMKETLQPQLYITQPIRELSWVNGEFHENSNYKPGEDWSLIDAVVHPSGIVSAVVVKLDMNSGADYVWHIKVLRFKADGSFVESELSPLPVLTEQSPAFPFSYDRVKLVAYGEELFVVARWKYNIIEAYHLLFANSQFVLDWQKTVEPGHFVGLIGIIGGGFDNFHQGDRYCFVYADVDSGGNLFVAAPSSEDLLVNHDQYFKENLTASADPSIYDFGVAVLTKFSYSGERLYSKVEARSAYKRLINMRVSDDNVYLIGRVKTGQQPNSWDAWVYAADAPGGNQLYESTIDLQDGDMFWTLDVFGDGRAIAVGSSGYTQNPAGLSVSDVRSATAVVLDAQGKVTATIDLPQGPSGRGSEAMFAKVLPGGQVLFAGVHNAPGTHASIYCDGFVAVRDVDVK